MGAHAVFIQIIKGVCHYSGMQYAIQMGLQERPIIHIFALTTNSFIQLFVYY